MAKHRITERRLVDVLVSYYKGTHAFKREFKHFEKRIDLVLIEHDDDEISVVEAKLADWQKAIQQAMLNLTAGNKSYIAIWNEKAHLADEKVLKHHGIGLISVGSRWGEVETLLPAQPSRYQNKFVKDRILENFRGDST